MKTRSSPSCATDVRTIGYHDYEYRFDPNTGVYSLFFDGALVTDSNATPSLVGGGHSATQLRFGGFGGSSGDTGDVTGYWNLVELANIPEPTSLAILILGAMLCGKRRRA